MIWARPPTGAKLVGSPGKGKSASAFLASKVVVLKVQGGGVRHVHLPLDPLPVVCSSTSEPSVGAATTLRHVAVVSWKTDGLHTGL